MFRKNKNVKNIAYKFELKPNQEQITLICKTFGCSRKIWNLMLDYYQKINKIITPAHFKDEYEYLGEVDSLALANVQMNLSQAIKNHFKNPKHFEKPKFKSRAKTKRSYTTNFVKNNIEIKDDKIKLPKLGWVKFIKHRELPNYKIKSVTISQKIDKFYLVILFEYEQQIYHQIDETKAIGLDYKSDGFYVDSNGETIGSPDNFRKAQKRLKKQQQSLSRKIGYRKNERKSKNWIKQKAKVDKIYQHTANQRKDFAHKQSRILINNYDIICLEDINMQNIARCLKLAKRTYDNGFGMFRDFLEYKAKNEGKEIIYVDRFFASSKTCHCCGYKKIDLILDDRNWTCPNCHTHHDRDYNAAINILNEGLRIYHEKLNKQNKQNKNASDDASVGWEPANLKLAESL